MSRTANEAPPEPKPDNAAIGVIEASAPGGDHAASSAGAATPSSASITRKFSPQP